MSKPQDQAQQNKALYPAQQYQQQQQAPQAYPVATPAEDERLARQLQAQYDREAYAVPVIAQPALPPMDIPFNCGHCGMPHLVRHVTNNTAFQCTRCGRQNQIVIENSRPVVIVRRASWVPIPIFCNIQ